MPAKCLIVDDSAMIRSLLGHALQSFGWETIVEAEDAERALERIDASVELVITDAQMPGMGGVELVRRLRANPATAGVRVLLVTATSSTQDLREAKQAGIDGYIPKPFTPELVRIRVGEVMRRPQARAPQAG